MDDNSQLDILDSFLQLDILGNFIINSYKKSITRDCISNQSYWKGKSFINNLHVYIKAQFKTETTENGTRIQHGQFDTTELARRGRLLA